MPISAAAEKLKRELNAPKDAPHEPVPAPKVVPKQQEIADPTKQKGKSQKTKLASKTNKSITQAEALIKGGVPPEEVPKFQDAHYWIQYFPPIGMVYI